MRSLSLCFENQFSFTWKIQFIAVEKISLLDSLWKRDWGELGNGLFLTPPLRRVTYKSRACGFLLLLVLVLVLLFLAKIWDYTKFFRPAPPHPLETEKCPGNEIKLASYNISGLYPCVRRLLFIISLFIDHMCDAYIFFSFYICLLSFLS